MAGGKSNYFEAKLLEHVFAGATLTLPASLHVALSTAVYSEAATGTSMAEVTGSGYVRVAVTRNTTNFVLSGATAPASISNGTAVTFPVAGASWGTVTSFYVVDAASGGNVLYGADMGTARAVIAGDVPSFAPGTLTFTED